MRSVGTAPAARVLTPSALALALACAFGVAPPSARAQPSGAVAVHGTVTLSQPSAQQLLVTTTNGAGTGHSVVNWQSFSIPGGSQTHIAQPTHTSLSINRVVAANPSLIYGTLSSNGQVLLVNPAGITVGAGAVVDTAGFQASTLPLGEADAVAGRLRFGGAGGELVVNGQIVAREGDVVLVAPQVTVGAGGVVQSPNGSVILAAGQQAEITGRGLEGITLQVQAPTDRALNLGTLKGDAVGLFAGTLRHSGLIQATAVGTEGGRVVLKALERAELGGTVTAQRGDRGGVVHATGRETVVTAAARIDASGAAGGGEVLIGGGWQGQDTRLANATFTRVDTGSVVRADATAAGDGGTVVLWSDGTTAFGGTVSARGGDAGGDGGQVEVSGKQHLLFVGQVDTSAPQGNKGVLLLDPVDITIAASADSNISTSVVGGETVYDSNTPASILGESTLETALATSNVRVKATGGGGGTATGSISVTADIEWSSGSTLTLESETTGGVSFFNGGGAHAAAGTLVVQAGSLGMTVASTAGGLAVDTLDITTTGTSAVSFQNFSGTNSANSLTVNAGGAASLRFTQNSTLAVQSINAGGAISLNLDGSGTLALNGNVSTTDSIYLDTETGGITQSAGTLQGTALTFTSTGNVSLTSSNQVDSLEATMSSGSLTFKNGKNLTLDADGGTAISFAGNASAINIEVSGGTLTVTKAVSSDSGSAIALKSSGNLTVDDNVTSTGGTVLLESTSGNVTVSSTGSVQATGLALKAGGNADLSAASSVDFATVAANVTGNLVLDVTSDLSVGTVAGVAGVTVGGAFSVTLDDANLTQSQAVSVGGLTTVSSNTGDLTWDNASNNFNQVDIEAGVISLRDINALTVQSLVQNGTNQTLTIQTGGNLSMSNQALDTGTANLTLNSGGLLAQNGTLAGNNIGLTGGGGVQLNANVTAAGTLSLSSTNALITQGSGTVVATGTTTVNAGSGQVDLLTASNNFSTLVATGGAVTVYDTNALTLGAVNASSLTVNTSANNGAVTQSAAATVSGATSINAGTGAITLTQAGNNWGSLGATGGVVSVTDTNALALNAITASSLTVNTSANNGAVTQTAAATVSGAASFNTGTGALTLTQANQFASFGATGGAVSVTESGALALDAITASSLTVNTSAGNGAVTQTAALTVSGATSVNAGTGVVTLTNAGNALGSFGATASTASVVDSNALALDAINVGSLSVNTSAGNGAVTQTAAATVTGTTVVSAGTGAITLTQSGNNFASVGASGGAVSVKDSNALVLNTITASSLSVDTSAGNGAVTQSAALTVSGATAVNAGTGAVTLSNGGNNLGSFGATAGAVTVTESASLSLDDISASGNVSVTAGTTLSQAAGKMLSGKQLSLTAADIQLNGKVYPGGDGTAGETLTLTGTTVFGATSQLHLDFNGSTHDQVSVVNTADFQPGATLYAYSLSTPPVGNYTVLTGTATGTLPTLAGNLVGASLSFGSLVVSVLGDSTAAQATVTGLTQDFTPLFEQEVGGAGSDVLPETVVAPDQLALADDDIVVDDVSCRPR